MLNRTSSGKWELVLNKTNILKHKFLPELLPSLLQSPQLRRQYTTVLSPYGSPCSNVNLLALAAVPPAVTPYLLCSGQLLSRVPVVIEWPPRLHVLQCLHLHLPDSHVFNCPCVICFSPHCSPSPIPCAPLCPPPAQGRKQRNRPIKWIMPNSGRSWVDPAAASTTQRPQLLNSLSASLLLSAAGWTNFDNRKASHWGGVGAVTCCLDPDQLASIGKGVAAA